MPNEVEAYERFTARGHPPTILKYYGIHEEEPHGIILELAEKASLYKYLWIHYGRLDISPSSADLLRWAKQAAEGLAFAHSCGVFHSDIHCTNFFLDKDLNLKVGDFAGASLDGGRSWSFYRRDHMLPGTDGDNISIVSEIFALGSALYSMVMMDDVFPELHYEKDKEEIRRRFLEKEFPDTSAFPVLGEVVRKCWLLKYESMNDVESDIDAEIEKFNRLP